MNKDQMHAALKRLSTILFQNAFIGEMCLLGDAAMVFGYGADRTVGTIEAMIIPWPMVERAAPHIAKELNLPAGWVAECSDEYDSRYAAFRPVEELGLESLKVHAPEPEFMLAIKAKMAASPKATAQDRADVETLAAQLGVAGPDAVKALLDRYYGD